ncbi:MAG TPA: DUF4252 domain-containing protein [Steroidobacteraceae bacterium]|nr:DUF4252 domain-containing protein [Steroidobacteraceae bacterium]
MIMNAVFKHSILAVLGVLSLCSAASAEDGKLLLPEFGGLADKASEVVTITLDPALLGLAARFLDPNDAEDRAVREAIAGIKGIYVRSYKFDADFAYPRADVDTVRKQLTAPGWQRLVEVRSRKQQQNVDIYILVEQDRANGLAIIASEPREFTIVNIVGSIDMRKLHELEGQFGIPKMELEEKK